MKPIKIILFLFLVLISCKIGYAQDIHFSQYTEAPVALNPASIGVAYDTRAIANYRNQWGTVGKAYSTFGVTFEQAIKHLKLKGNYFGIALNIYSDQAGDAMLASFVPNLGISYVTRISKFAKLSAGIQAGVLYRTIDVSKLRWDEQFTENGYMYNSSAPTGENTPRSGIVSFDFGGGLNFHYAKSERFISAQDGTKFDVGFAAYHYNYPRNSFFDDVNNIKERLYTKYIIYANVDVGLKAAGIALVPSLLYMIQGPSTEITPGLMFKYIIEDQATYTNIKNGSAISFGAYYRVKDAIIPTILYQKNKIAIGVSYDINISSLTPASKLNGGIEVCLRFNTSPGYGKALGISTNRPTYK